MKKSFLTIATAISAAFLLAACSQTELVDDISSAKGNGTADGNAVTFSTYTAKKGETRAVDQTATAKLQETGFGVFAYYTPGKTYGEARDAGENTPNFMYNQKIEYKNSNWTYEPLKYWPNDFSEGDVDKNNPAAQGSGKNGNVSFFAYAPYTDVTTEATEGIIEMSANNVQGDPYIIYKGGGTDLLWGTFTNYNHQNAAHDPNSNSGVTGNSSSNDNYKKEIREGETVAADLTKQGIEDRVVFLFKHALAGINGFKVILDIDVFESHTSTDGKRETFQKNGQEYYRTIVTIEEVSLTEAPNANDDEKLVTSGKLNLATGQWSKTDESSESTPFELTISNKSNSGSIAMNSDIAEFNTDGSSYFNTTNVLDNFKKDDNEVNGVTEDEQKNVYGDEATPILLIPDQTPKFKIAVKYVVRQYDESVENKYTEIKNDISKVVTFPTLKFNTQYTIVMRLGLTSVKFVAQVGEWDKTSSSDEIIELPQNNTIGMGGSAEGDI